MDSVNTSTWRKSQGTDITVPNLIYSTDAHLRQCMQKIFAKCFNNIPALGDILEIDPEIATFCAVFSEQNPNFIPYITSSDDAQIIVRAPADNQPVGITESGVEISIQYIISVMLNTPAVSIRRYRRYRIHDNGMSAQTEWKILSNIDTLETEIIFSNSRGYCEW